MAGELHVNEPGRRRKPSTFRSYLKTRLIVAVVLAVAIIASVLIYFLNHAIETQFLARARAEKNLAETIIKERLEEIEERLKEIVNNNTVKITLMLGVKPQLRELLQQICPPANGVYYLVQGGPDNEFYPDSPKTLIELIRSTDPLNFQDKPHLLPDQWTFIFSQPIVRDAKTIGRAYCVYKLSNDDYLDLKLQHVGNNWFYFLLPVGADRPGGSYPARLY